MTNGVLSAGSSEHFAPLLDSEMFSYDMMNIFIHSKKKGKSILCLILH